jgi:hypothetical protein
MRGSIRIPEFNIKIKLGKPLGLLNRHYGVTVVTGKIMDEIPQKTLRTAFPQIKGKDIQSIS